MVSMTTTTIRGTLLALSLAALATGCSKSAPTPPSQTPEPATTITISRTGASPRSLTVPRGSQITFVNNDTVIHQMYSDPHPEHTDCPEFDSVGQLSPGQTRQTTNLVTSRTCNFHDHLDFGNSTLRGAIVIQ
jgi:plastocyanin